MITEKLDSMIKQRQETNYLSKEKTVDNNTINRISITTKSVCMEARYFQVFMQLPQMRIKLKMARQLSVSTRLLLRLLKRIFQRQIVSPKNN